MLTELSDTGAEPGIFARGVQLSNKILQAKKKKTTHTRTKGKGEREGASVSILL